RVRPEGVREARGPELPRPEPRRHRLEPGGTGAATVVAQPDAAPHRHPPDPAAVSHAHAHVHRGPRRAALRPSQPASDHPPGHAHQPESLAVLPSGPETLPYPATQPGLSTG